jgi:K(+)-stimulated pyrophosphate-energized sodium pump
MDLIPIILGFLGLLTAYVLYAVVKKYPAGDKNLTDISDEIHLGAMAFMKKEYSIHVFCNLDSWHIHRARP